MSPGNGHGEEDTRLQRLVRLVVRLVPLFRRVAPSVGHLVVDLRLGMELWVVVLLLILMRRVQWMGLRVVLTLHVVGVGRAPLLGVAGLRSDVRKPFLGEAVVRVVSRWRHGPGQVRLTQMLMASLDVRTHGSVGLALGVRQHGCHVSSFRPPLSLQILVISQQHRWLVIGVKILVFIKTTRGL